MAARDEPAAGGASNAERLLAENYARVYQAVLRLVHDPAEAEDLTQETFARAVRALPAFRGESSLLTWLTSIARNVVLDRFRAIARSRETGWDEGDDSSLEAVPDPAPTPPADALERNESGACIQACVDVLPASERQVIELHDMLGLTAREIAEMLGASPGAIKTRLHRARAKLRAAFARHCEVYPTDRNELACRPKPHAAGAVRRRGRRGPTQTGAHVSHGRKEKR